MVKVISTGCIPGSAKADIPEMFGWFGPSEEVVREDRKKVKNLRKKRKKRDAAKERRIAASPDSVLL